MFRFIQHEPLLADNKENFQVVHQAIKALNNLIDHYVNKERFKDASERTGIKLLAPWEHSKVACNGIGYQITGCVEIRRKKSEGAWSSLVDYPLMKDLLYSIGFSVCDDFSHTADCARFPIRIHGKTKISEIAEKCNKIIYAEIPEEEMIASLKSLWPTPG